MLKKLTAAAAVLMALIALFAATALAAPSKPVLGYIAADGVEGNTDIYLQEVRGEYYLFLPSCADLTELRLSFAGGSATFVNGTVTRTVKSGEPFDFSRLFSGGEESFTLTFVQRNRHIRFTVMKSENIRSLYITSADRENRSREWVEETKGNKAGGGAVLLRADGSAAYAGGIKSLRGRGNSTWNYPKKPYQLKLMRPADLLDSGETAKESDTWVLLANFIDESLTHNSLTLDLAREMDMPYPIGAEPVDLYYDGEYRGSYLLTEKVEVAEGRVDIRSLEAQIEAENKDVSDTELRNITVKSFSDNSAFKFTEGLAAPEDISGGYLLELELDYRALQEENWFKTDREQYVVVKSPKRVPHGAMTYIMELYESFENAVYNGGVDPVTGKDYRELCDLESLARTYLIMEFCGDNDAFRSSTFIYKSAGEEKLYFGPMWDFDTGYGSADMSQEFYVAAISPLGSALLALPSFREKVKELYENELAGLIENVILGDEGARGQYMRSIASYMDEVEASRNMNNVLWTKFGDVSQEDALENFRKYVSTRHSWLYGEIMSWGDEAPLGRRFIDVDREDWYDTAVAYVSDMGLIEGTTDVTFSPDDALTKAAAVYAVNALAGEEIPNAADGLGDLSEPATRGDLITILYRYARFMGIDTSERADLSGFEDVNEVRDSEAMSWAVSKGLTNGVGKRLAANDEITRSTAAIILYRLHLYVGE